MNKFIRYWNQNRKQIIIIIAIIAFIIIVIKVIDGFFDTRLTSNNNSIKTNDTMKPIQSVITGEKVSETKTEENTKVIEQFIKYCNNSEYNNAYNLLTDDCKEQFQNNIDLFTKNYVSTIFKTNKTYQLELWMRDGNAYTYQIKLYDDNLLATGGTSINSNIEDYITIVNQNNENKININYFINKEVINKSKEMNGITITINDKNVYKNYETYNITIQNNTENTIVLSPKQSGKDICLIDQNSANYISFLNEISQDSLILKAGYKKSIDVRFNKMYDLNKTIKKIKFSNIIMNQEKYVQNPSDSSIEKTELEINL